MIQYSRKKFLVLMTSSAALSALGCGGDEGGGAGTGSGGSSSGGSGNGTGGDGSSSGGTTSGSGGSTSSSGGMAGDSGTGSGTGGDDGGTEPLCDGDHITALCSPAGGHTHVLSIPVADILAGTGGTYISGETVNGVHHCHQVTLSAADMETLRDGGVVRKRTCNGGPHEFVISCGDNPPAPEPPMDCGGSTEGTPASCPNP